MILIRARPSFIYCRTAVRNLSKHAATESKSSAADDVLFTSHKNKGIITLNRPQALNTLNLSMVSKMYPILKKWEKEKTLVIVKGAGGKAFCAGGDVREIVQMTLKGVKFDLQVFYIQYIIDGMVGTYSIPYVALIDGIVMGGGVGLTVHGRYRIATEKTIFAMPETAIGLFPDVGASYFLPRMSGKLGYYLALTGHRLKGSDVFKAGVATHFCESGRIKDLEDNLLNCKNSDEVDTIINRMCQKDTERFSLEPHLEKINKYFSNSTVEAIITQLEKDQSEWAQTTIKTLSKMSPTSLKITLKQLNLGSNMNLRECLRMDYRMTIHCLRNKDFFEGVRAQLIDKDQKPAWSPKTLEEVTEKIVDSYFEELPTDEELKN